MYTLYQYGRMIGDGTRTGAYRRALQQVVQPGRSVVLDLGTGPGILALLACQAGARHVYAVESDEVIHLAKELAAANGFADRITFIQGLSTEVTLPEPVDIVVSELHGVLPVYQTTLVSLLDARQRLLAPGGTFIPKEESLWAAVVEAPELYDLHVAPWRGDAYGLDLGRAQAIIRNTYYRGCVLPGQVLVEPRKWASLNYSTLQSPHLRGEVCWKVVRAGTAHGLCLWFDCALADGVAFSNAPGEPETIFGQGFFPWSQPVSLVAGDAVSVALEAHQAGTDYVWRWTTRVLEGEDPARVKADFAQSTFHSMPLSLELLRKQSAEHVPQLSERGEIDRWILNLMDSRLSLGEIAQRVREQFVSRFPAECEAQARVARLSRKYSPDLRPGEGSPCTTSITTGG